jgi:DNA-binding NtrC family response regulator
VSPAAGDSRDLEQLAEALALPAAAPAVTFDEHEKVLVSDALGQSKGNQSEAARTLRISRDRLRYKMAKYNLR